jgi:hypothetical protein
MSDLSQLLRTPDASLEAKDDFFAINELYLEKGWGDGLPLIPPTEARVAAMLEKFITRHATLALGAFSRENIERRIRVAFAASYKDAPVDAPVPMIHNADNLLIAVIGGAGKHSAVIPTFGATQAVTRALKRKDGAYARSMQDMRCA